MTVAEAYYPPEEHYQHDSTLSELQMLEPQSSMFLDEQDQSNQTWRVQQGKSIPTERKFQIVVSNGLVPAWLKETVESLNSLLALADNWDSYGAHRISDEAALATIQVLGSVMEEHTPLPSIVPTPSGNIQLEWHRFGIDLEVEITPSRRYSVSFEDETEEAAPYEDGASHHSVYDPQPLLNLTNLVTRRATMEG